MGHRVCPWWLGYWLINPLRRLGQNPEKILAPYVRQGMTILEPGPGMGFFTLDIARMVGPGGRVIAVDVQQKMLDRLRRRADKAGLSDRIGTRLAAAGSMGIGDLEGAVDFTAAFYVVHELPDTSRFFAEVAAASKPGATVIVVEPKGHVKEKTFAAELDSAAKAGFAIGERPVIRRSLAAVLKKT
jgi:ubiquinone/menaquinone biosynthesis C-methylase UbiE